MAETNPIYENVEMAGDIPLPRFGHTMTAISKTDVVLFGGAIGDSGKYTMTGDTYIYNIPNRYWSKPNIQGILPTPRAAHAATAIDAMQVVMYGGASGGINKFYILRWYPSIR